MNVLNLRLRGPKLSEASIAMPDRERARQHGLKALQSCHDDARFTDLAISCLFRHYDSSARRIAMVDVLQGKSNAVVFRGYLKVLPSCHEARGHEEEVRHYCRRILTAIGGIGEYDRQDGEALDALPDVITVFRGCSRDRINGLSWSLDRETARSFAIGGHHDVSHL
jgi:hypothetical protein